MSETNQGLSKLLRRYQLGKCTEEDARVVDQWFNAIHYDIADRPLGDDANQIKQRIWENIQLADAGKADTFSLVGKWWTSWRVAGIAACILFVIGLAFYEFQYKSVFDRTGMVGELGMKVISNHGSQPKQFQLADKSLLTLGPGSSLRLADDFGKAKRDVYLKGSGFFEVSHNKDKPFVVYAGKIASRVVGTSFSVRLNAGNVEVEVVTGKVIVEKTGASGSNGKSVVLVPNQKVTFDQDKDYFITGLVKEPVLIERGEELAPAAVFNFDDVPLSDVVSVLEASYGIKILVRNEQIKSCPIRADLGQQPLYTKLDIICAALQAHYDVKGTTIIISGGQCN
ncbi:FecR family protein [Dyadobacter pollutisoli]|uniref:FecR domain-containing protein n=1 Tax=Dyadobacter pollutisoli TaxID=2910158 RepID=A0A9E8SMQ7_9BACT|nr:FecR family protein [Dyadobacter pollutisoli]WAC15015.1 FecR domain-containing protein [Dyadobacter pollutisoli]